MLTRFSYAVVATILVGCQRSGTPSPNRPETSIGSTSLYEAHEESPASLEVPSLTHPIDVDALFLSGDFDRAEAVLKDRLLLASDDCESLFWMARIKAARGQFGDAVEFLDAIPARDVAASTAALGQSAQWLEELQQWDQAVKRYQTLLQRIPHAAIVQRPLARILNRQGRRAEAAQLVIDLCRQGNIEEEELRSLITWSHAFASSDVGDSFEAIGPLGFARVDFSLANYQQVVDSLRPLAFGDDDAIHALYGRALALLQDWASWKFWHDHPVHDCADHADYWYAKGMGSLMSNDIGGSVVCFSEVIVRDPTDHTAYVRYGEALARAGMHAESQSAMQRSEVLRKTNELGVDFARGHRDVQRFAELADLLDTLGRPFEAIAWRVVSLAYHRDSIDANVLARLQQELRVERQRLIQSSDEATESDLLCGLRRNSLRERYPSSDWMPLQPKLPPKSSDASRTLEPLILCNVSSGVGLVHVYDNRNASHPEVHGILQEMGSGVAVTDFDLDGRPDVYLLQAAATPMRQDGLKANLLYRNLGGRFELVTSLALADDRSFSQGATSGDVNQDGFPDLCIANVGANLLLINNGDGTFASRPLSTPEAQPLWTASLAIGDLSGDHLPDVIEVNYIDDVTAFERHANPRAFDHAVDRVHFSDGRGDFQTVQLGNQPASGLGVILTDLDGDRRNEVFIANDGVPDRLWKRQEPSPYDATEAAAIIPKDAAAGDANRLYERAVQSGCAVGFQGLAGASMGIAVDDFNHDGKTDLFLTQFYQEPDVFFFQSDQGTFIDHCVQVGTHAPSLKVLGFGTQSIDLDNDGDVEIAVLNGHTARSINPDIPYEMLPQMYRRDSSGKYTVADIDDASEYWQSRALGRGLSKLDWDGDGRMDLIATHLDAPTALLENRTAGDDAWLQLRLVGTTSERDAIGAHVSVASNEWKRSKTVNSGDGYCGKNEAILHFGLANSISVEVEVNWPSGQSNQLRIDQLNQRWLIIEGDEFAYDDRTDTRSMRKELPQ